MRRQLQNRPTETTSGLGLAGSVIALCITNGVPAIVAVVVGLVVGVGPTLVSNYVDAVRR